MLNLLKEPTLFSIYRKINFTYAESAAVGIKLNVLSL